MKRWPVVATVAAATAAVVVGGVIGARSASTPAPAVAASTPTATVETGARSTPSPVADPVTSAPRPSVAPDSAGSDGAPPVDVGPDALMPDFDVLAPVSLTDNAAFGDGVTAALLEVDPVTPRASGPGETKKPAVAVTVDLTNGTDAEINLDAVVVDVYGADGAPGMQYLADTRTTPFEGTLAPGGSARGTYVVAVPDVTNDITVTVSYGPGRPAVSFTGKA